MTATTMSEALEKSGVAIGRSTAYTAAAQCLARASRRPNGALPEFYAHLAADSAGLVEVVGETQIRVACLGYLERVAADMNNSESGGHPNGDARRRSAPDSPKRGADGGQISGDAQSWPASTAPQQIANGEGHATRDAHTAIARPVREPSKGQIAAAKRVGDKLATSIMDTFKITERQGSRIAVGDVKAHSWGRMAKSNAKSTWVRARETELCIIMSAFVNKQAHVPKDANTRDIVSADAMKSAIAESAKIADYQSRITSVIQEIAHD